MPIHNTVGLLLAVTVGFALTVKERVVVFVHPDTLDPVKVYTVVLVGFTVIVLAVKPPGLQV